MLIWRNSKKKKKKMQKIMKKMIKRKKKLTSNPKNPNHFILLVLKDVLRLWKELLFKTNNKKYLMITDITLKVDFLNI